MPYIFRFHKGTNNNIFDWMPSDKIGAAAIQGVLDKTNTLSSSTGTSIPTPIARLFLFRTAFEITADQLGRNIIDAKSIYAGFVSETLDLLELLYKSGGDKNKFEYKRWVFENSDQGLKIFGDRPGHRLLAQSFKQAANQPPFNGRIEINLIYYKEGNKKVLIGGTSPFTFVFTTPNFKRKMLLMGFKDVTGLASNHLLFTSSYLQLQQRESGFIKYIQSLANNPGIDDSFNGFAQYVNNSANKYPLLFNGELSLLDDIRFEDTPLTAGNVPLRQISEKHHRSKINSDSDFKMVLPEDTHFKGDIAPLFLISKMVLDGQYTSESNLWSSNTVILQAEYPETLLEEVFEDRELPGLPGIKYPFFSSFDFFERSLIRFKSPGYMLNDKRYVTLVKDQDFAIPIKPWFFHFFPIHTLKNMLTVDVSENEVKFTLKIPISGPTRHVRYLICSKVFNDESFINYSGILGIFPFTRTRDEKLLHINQYTVASYEKTNADSFLESIQFINEDGINTVSAITSARSVYADINAKSTYYQLKKSFDLIQLNFKKDNRNNGGIILPIFDMVENGDAEYIYAIDFGTSNTHIEYGLVGTGGITEAFPYQIEEKKMQMYLLNKPQYVDQHDGETVLDYEESMGYVIEKARQMTLREFVPFQIGAQRSATVKFPFRTATCESNTFINSSKNDRLFLDANIGFNIDADVMSSNVRYKTDLKWLLQQASSDQFNINRVSIFARQLMLMIRTKALLEDERADLFKLKIIMAFPISMSDHLKEKLSEIFDAQRLDIFSENSQALLKPVTESIAPYYQLKANNLNISNDNFCNIDIGGGTTDIVLTKTEELSSIGTNELQCYCSSFRFAGRQLWSSGSNEYNTEDNGFVSYYKQFINKVDKTTYTSLERVLNGRTMKTEDVVGYLFSNNKLKFREIFSENREFRVIPLIHYSAILYYITKLATWKEIDLPRTVSFSGKGSEYLNLLFSKKSDLKGFTETMLEIFSGTQTRDDFIIEKADDPKVITAKGALYYAVESVNDEAENEWGNRKRANSNPNEKRLIKNNIVYKGFKTLENESKQFTYADLMQNDDLFRDIIDNHIEFFNLLFDNQQLQGLINKRLEINNFVKYKQFFIPAGTNLYKSGVLRDSFKTALKSQNPTDPISDSPFFFPLDYSLIGLSKVIATNSKI